MEDKIANFFENARLLNERFDITPLLYGSLGLQYITTTEFGADDIDMLIPARFLGEEWSAFKAALEENGYVLIDEHEHTFEKGGCHYAYASIEELATFAGIRESELERRHEHGAAFTVLSLRQYLAVYRASAKDGYRIHVRQKKDADKIAFIESRLCEK